MSDGLPVASDVHTIILDFDGVFTDNKVWVGQGGREWVRCDRADGLAMDLLRTACRRGLIEADVFILSTETNPVVRERAAKLRLTCHQGVSDKLAFVEECLATRFPDSVDPFSGVVFLGNDLNDLPLLRRVGWAVVPASTPSSSRRGRLTRSTPKSFLMARARAPGAQLSGTRRKDSSSIEANMRR